MSLSTFLTNIDNRKMFKENFIKPKIKYEKELVNPPLTTNYSLIGVAFDYLVRYYLESINGNLVSKSSWVSSIALDNSILNVEDKKNAEIMYKEAEIEYGKYLKTFVFSDQLIGSVIKLAQLDYIYRAKTIIDNFGIVNKADIEDLRNLISGFIQKNWKADKRCILNPTFGAASIIVGGADADIIIDNTLIELKVVKSSGLDRETFNQMVGYYLLNTIQTGKLYDIERIACYSARYNELFIYNISEIANTETIKNFVPNFVTKCQEQYPIPDLVFSKLNINNFL